MKIAVIGSGISGFSSAYYLSKKHKVDLFEKQDRFGGHSYTLDIKLNDNEKVAVDIGFMVFNKDLLKYLTDEENCDFEYNALEKLAKVGEVMVFKHEGHWDCMDHERDLNHLNKLWNNGNAFWKKW